MTLVEGGGQEHRYTPSAEPETSSSYEHWQAFLAAWHSAG